VTSDQRGVTIFSLPGTDTAAEAVDQIGNVEQVTVVSRRQTTINGLNAYELIASMTQENTSYNLDVTAIEYAGRVYRFLSYSTMADAERFSPAFRTTANGFQEVTSRAILAIQPTRIRILQADRSGPFRSFLPATLPDGIDAEDLAIINHVMLDEVIPAGKLLKIPR
jgi:predicted Zn-dependent protease